MASQTLPVPQSLKPEDIDAHSVLFRWNIPDGHGLSHEQLKELSFEFTDGNLSAECTDIPSSTLFGTTREFKARLHGLSPQKKYKFKVRSKLKSMTSNWSNRLQIETEQPAFIITADDTDLQLSSLRHRLIQYMNENKKLQLQVTALETQLSEVMGDKPGEPGHWSWNAKKIVKWIMRIDNGAFKEYEKTLLKVLNEDGVTGRDLVSVNETDLKSWGIDNFKKRKILTTYIQNLTENDAKPDIVYDPDLAKMLSVTPSISRMASMASPKAADSSQIVENEAEKKEKDQSAKAEEVEAPKEEQQVEEPNEEEIIEPKDDGDEKGDVNAYDTNNVLTQSVMNILDDEPPKTWRYKEGMLSVTVIRATNVDNMDVNQWLEDNAEASDPYVELELKGNYKVEKTKVHGKSLHPVWNEKFQLFVDDAKQDVLKARLYDHNKWGKDDKIGEVQIPVITILGANGYMKKEFEVIGSKCGAKLELELKYWESRA